MDLSFFTDGRALLFLIIATTFYYFVLDNNQLQKKAPRSGVSHVVKITQKIVLYFEIYGVAI